MKAKLIVEGKEFDIDIFDPELVKLVKPENNTGYENCGYGHTYYYVNNYGEVKITDHLDNDDDKRYNEANYYRNCDVAENNARADRLMRQLRRFAVEHRENDLNWGDRQWKYRIYYSHSESELYIGLDILAHDFGAIYFDSKDACELAIKTFHDELVWYFTKYKDSI